MEHTRKNVVDIFQEMAQAQEVLVVEYVGDRWCEGSKRSAVGTMVQLIVVEQHVKSKGQTKTAFYLSYATSAA